MLSISTWGGAGCNPFESAWFQLLKLICDEPLSQFAFSLNLSPYNEDKVGEGDQGKGGVKGQEEPEGRKWVWVEKVGNKKGRAEIPL